MMPFIKQEDWRVSYCVVFYKLNYLGVVSSCSLGGYIVPTNPSH